MGGLVVPHRNIFHVKPILIALFTGLFILSLNKINKRVKSLSILLLGYLIYSTIIAFNGIAINMYDYLLAYLAFFYMFMLLFFVRKEYFSKKIIERLFLILIAAFFLKYLISIIFGFSTRPGLFTENNFELMFLSLLYIAYYHIQGRINFCFMSILIGIFILSGSKSGIVTLIFTLFILHFKKKYLKIKFLHYYLFLTIFVLFAVVRVFGRLENDGGIENIDRVKFLLVFLENIEDWNWMNYFVGSPLLTPLNDSSCSALSYYDRLFSFKNDGSCYSVVLHSFILRLIFDHGILGLLFILYFLNRILLVTGYNLNERLAIIGVFILNGFSVSSVNSIYGIIGLVLLITVKKDKYYEKKHLSNYSHI